MMTKKQESPWSLKAEVTIQHTNNQPNVEARFTRPNGQPGLQMICKFGPGQVAAPNHQTRPHSFNFQRGNILFTSTPPPPRSPPLRWNTIPRTGSSGNEGSSSSTTPGVGFSDSGYNSERSKLYRPHDHRCKSTCKIILSANADNRLRGPFREEVMRYRFSTVPEGCEECTYSGNTTSHVCSKDIARLTISKDVASQTSEMGSRSSSISRASKSRKKRTPVESAEDDAKKKTVHIDVYCTGTEEDQSTDSSVDTETAPQTVFEDKSVKVTHVRARNRDLPQGFRDKKAFLKRGQQRVPSIAASTSFESDGSLYPSQFSSYSGMRNWSTASSTSLPHEECDSTSWKDTVSDFESLNTGTVTPCDSFEYLNPKDRLRIQHLELKNQVLSSVRKQKRSIDDNVSDDSNSSEDLCWGFVIGDEEQKSCQLKRDETVKRSPARSVPLEEIAAKLKQFKGPGDVPSRAQSAMTSPFGERTDHITRASKFGPVITASRKPGHHVGPSKNPSCSCEHCRQHFDEITRKRSLSLSEFERRILKPGRSTLY